MTTDLAADLLDRMSASELEIAARVTSVLPALADVAAEVDQTATFHLPHVSTLSNAGLLGLVVPTEFGGLGGGLRDLAAATYVLATACPSTSLAFFFHCSSASRGLLALDALEAGLFDDEEAPQVRSFAEKVLRLMGEEGKWLANFASESAKSTTAKISISTTATKVDGGWSLSGVKAFGCATGVADNYLVTAMLDGATTAEGLCTFLVGRDDEGVSERTAWNAMGMRGTATHGIVLEDVFVADENALTVPGAFVRMMQMSRGSFVGNQLAATAVYAGASRSAFDFALAHLTTSTFRDTGTPIGEAPFLQQLIGEMAFHQESAMQWLRRQLELETSEPPIKDKEEVVTTWRLSKGGVCEHAHAVCRTAMKACGTSNTMNDKVISRAFRDTAMGLVQAFPHERGKLEAAHTIFHGKEETQFEAAQS